MIVPSDVVGTITTVIWTIDIAMNGIGDTSSLCTHLLPCSLHPYREVRLLSSATKKGLFYVYDIAS